MKALSLHQPWAQLIALGWKHLETRSWSTRYRGPIAICAAKTTASIDQALTLAPRAGFPVSALPPFTDYRTWSLGKVVAVATLTDCFRVVRHGLSARGSRAIVTGDGRAILVREADLVLGDLSPGRFGWRLEDVRALPVPISVRGRQGLWTLDESTERAVRTSLEMAAVGARS